MKKIIWFGLAGVGVVWGILSWIQAHGFLDFASLIFIILCVVGLSLFTAAVWRGEAHG